MIFPNSHGGKESDRIHYHRNELYYKVVFFFLFSCLKISNGYDIHCFVGSRTGSMRKNRGSEGPPQTQFLR